MCAQDKPTYREYVSDREFYRKYRGHQQRYVREPRESDKVLITLVERCLEEMGPGEHHLLDIGCSTGNLLRHLKRRALPGLTLHGGDLMAPVIDDCRRDPELEGIEFAVMDIMDLPGPERYDIVVANAVLSLFDEDQYRTALASLARALRPGGWLVAFEWIHEFPQLLHIVEYSDSHPEGMSFYFRPREQIDRMLGDSGFSSGEYHPFHIPIDLPPDADPVEHLCTYTVRTAEGRRLLFRGTLSQPWCHFRARRQPQE